MNAEQQRVLVTGGAGFIGANLVRMLLDQGREVTVLDNLSTGRREYLERLPIQLLEGDILDRELARRAVPGHTAVIHLAADSGVAGSLDDPELNCRLNVFGTLNLLEACRRSRSQGASPDGGPKFIFASSNAVLGRQPPPATEETLPLPASPYGAGKLAGEAYCRAYHACWGLPTLVLRFGNVYGPFSGHKTSIVATFFKQLLRDGTLTIHGDGGQSRDFIYVSDLCRALTLAVDSTLGGEILQTAAGAETTVLELAALVQQIADRSVPLAFEAARQGDIRKNYSSVGKAARLLGWRPTTALSEGLEQTWRWFSGAS